MKKSQNPEVVALAFDSAKTYLHVQIFGAALMIPMHFYRSIVQSMGKAIFPTIGAFLQAIARALTVIFLVPLFGIVAVCLPDAIAALFTLPLVIIPYRYYINKLECQD